MGHCESCRRKAITAARRIIPNDAEDAYQDACMKLERNGKLATHKAPCALVVSTTRNVARDKARKIRREIA